MTPILELELFDMCSIDFMGPFVSFHGMTYILVSVDYEYKWVEVVVLPNNENRNVTASLKMNIFSQFGTPYVLLVMVSPIFSIVYLKPCLKNIV